MTEWFIVRGRTEWLPILGAIAIGAAFLFTAAPHLPVLLWNATASAPLGLYRLRPNPEPKFGDWVALRPPTPVAGWLAAGGYLPLHVPLLKQVAAVPGQTICRRGAEVLVDRRVVATAMMRDRRGVALPAWCGCRRLGKGEVFLLSAPAGSLDGRYFGPSSTGDLIGRAEPLWTWSAAR